MGKLNLQDKQQILQRIQKGDRSVLGDLFQRYRRLVVGYVRQHGGGASDGEDILQEAIVVLWEKAAGGRLTLTCKLSTYVLAVAKNKWRSELRKRRRIENSDALPELIDDRPSLLDSMIDNEQVERLQQALDQLSPGCRQLLMLFYFEEKSMKDVAVALGFGGTDVAKSKKYQCKKQLIERFQQLSARAAGELP